MVEPLVRCTWPSAAELTTVDTQDAHVKSLVSNLWRSRDEGDFCFQVRGDTLRAHRCIISAVSPVFKAMLASEMTEAATASVTIDAEPADVMAMLRFAYVGELDATPQQLPGVLQLSHKYEILSMIPLCCDAMVRNLNAETVVPYVRTLRLLEGIPMELPYARAPCDAPAPEPHSSSSASLLSGVARAATGGGPFGPAPPLFGVPAQPSTAALGAPLGPAPPLFGVPTQPATTTGTLLGSPFAPPPQPRADGGGPLAEPVQLHKLQPQAAPGLDAGTSPKAEGLTVSPIARAFVTIAKYIAGDPELQMITLREL